MWTKRLHIHLSLEAKVTILYLKMLMAQMDGFCLKLG
jgi:hypothetical protein